MEDIDELLDVGVLNAMTLSDAMVQYQSLNDFLHADLHLSFHSTYVSNPEKLLKMSYDVDGLVVELKNLTGLVSELHYILLPAVQLHMLKDSYHFLKKHIDLTACTPAGIKALRNSVCHTLGYVDGGYHLSLMLLPACLKDPDTRLFQKDLYKTYACELLNHIRWNFQCQLKGSSAKDKCRPTLQKQVLSDTSSFNVLQPDAFFVFSLLDKAIKEVTDCAFLKPALYLTRFGQKLKMAIDLTDLVDPSAVASLSIHLAATISARDPDIHTLFSRFGLEDVVGSRGSLYSILGMHEATNYQTDLDHLPLQLSNALLRVLKGQGKLNFLQLYVDSPHVHLKMPFKHPVSGAIVTCGLSHPQFHKALLSRASMYLRHMEDLKDKMVTQLKMRIEQVRLFSGEIPDVIFTDQYFSKPDMMTLVRENAIVIPFKESACNHGLVSTLREVLHHLVQQLWALYTTSEGVANYDACWKAFQTELALEELFYGHPLSTADYALSVSLGTNTVNPNSITHSRGFIGLAPHSSASAGEKPPPLEHWTRNDLQKSRIERIFPFCQTLDAAPSLIGSALLRLLLCDIFKRNTEIPFSALTSKLPPGRLAGSQKVELLCEDLSVKKSFPAPHTFGRARAILVRAGKDVKDCLVQGFKAEKFKFFPSIKFRDLRGSQKIFWNGRDYTVLEAEEATSLSTVATATLQVCTEVERRSLAYSRTLEKYREHGMVWMEAVLQRLPPSMKGALHLNVITFVSCVAMIMNGDFIDYKHLRSLLEEMSSHLSQATLQKWRILSNFTIPKVYNFLIWKVHEDIPYRVQQKPKGSAVVKPREEREEEQPYEDVQEVDDQDNIRPTVRSEPMTLPANTKKKWTEEEENMINQEAQVKDRVAYDLYVKKCHQTKVPIRTFKSFQAKRWRLMEKGKQGSK